MLRDPRRRSFCSIRFHLGLNLALLGSILFGPLLGGCGGGGGTAASPTSTSVSVTCSPSSIAANQTSACSATTTGSGSGGVTWSVAPTGIGSVSSSGVFTPAAAGTATITATSIADSTKSGSTTVTVSAVVTGVSTSCVPTTVVLGLGSQCTATVQGSSSVGQNVTWAVNGISGGSGALGSISSGGVYTAPVAMPSSSTVTITATSQVDNTKSGSVPISLAYGIPSIGLLSPQSAPIGSAGTPLSISGSNFTSASTVSANGTALPTTFVSPTSVAAVLPASLESAGGIVNIIVTNPSPGGGASVSIPFQVVAGTLSVQVSDLPSGALAALTVTGPNGFSANLAGSQVLSNLSFGTYTITASKVLYGNYSYYPLAASQPVTISDSSQVNSSVDYYNIAPSTTKVLDAIGLSSLQIGADGQTYMIAAQSAVATSLSANDVLVVGQSPVTPAGAILRIKSAFQTNGWVVVVVTPASITDAFQQVQIQSTGLSLNMTAEAEVTGLASGVRVFRGPQVARPEATSLPDSCANQQYTFIKSVDTPLSEDPASPLNSVTVSGDIEVCPSFDASLSTTFGFINSASFTLHAGEHTHVQAIAQYVGNLDQRVDLAKITYPPVLVDVAGVPIYITPQVTFYVQVTGNLTATASVGVSQDATLDAGFQYANGSSSPVYDFHNNGFAADQPQLQGQAQIKGSAGIEISASLYGGVLIPHESLSFFAELKADTTQNPWWTVDAGLDGDLGVEINALDIFTADPTWSTNIYTSPPILNAAGPFVTTPLAILAISPTQPVASATSQPISIQGSGLAQVNSVSLCHQGSCSSVVVSGVNSSGFNLTAILSAGRWSIQATDSNGNSSNVVPFTVLAAPSLISIQKMLPSIVSASYIPQSFTVATTGAESGVDIIFCHSGSCLQPVGGQLSSDGVTVTASVAIDAPGAWTAELVNTDGTSSAAFSFIASGALSASISPTGGQVNSTNFYASGSGATPGNTVTISTKNPSGQNSLISVPADGNGRFAFGPFTESAPGVYSFIFSDQTTDMESGTVTLLLSNGVSAQISPLGGNALSTPFTVSGIGATPNGTVTAMLSGSLPSMTTTASSSGAFTFMPFQAASAGAFTVQCTDVASGARTNSIQFTVNSAVQVTANISPNTGIKNSTYFTISGSGAGRNGGVTVNINYPDGSMHLIHTQSTASTFSFVPQLYSLPGNYVATVVDDASQAKSAPITWTVDVDAQQAPEEITVYPTSWAPNFPTSTSPIGVLSFKITGTAGTPINGTVTSSQPWLLVDGHSTESWSAPENITLNVNPTTLTPGVHTATLTVTSPNATNSPITVPITATVRAPLQILTTSIPDVLGGQSYLFQFQAQGGTGSDYTWTVASGYLPYGISLDPATGILSGNPVEISSSTTIPLGVSVSDSSGTSTLSSLTLTYRGGLEILNYSPSNFQFTVGTTYSSGNSITISTAGGVAPITLSASGLPQGLVLNSNTGLITGTPTKQGSFPVLFSAQDPKGDTANTTLVLQVHLNPLQIQTAPTLPSAQIGTAYQVPVIASGGSYSGYTWNAVGGLPSGLSAVPNTGCTQCGVVLTGTPTSTGAFPLTLSVTDSLGDTTQQMFTLVVDSSAPPQLGAAALPLGMIGSPFAYTFTASGGSQPYSFAFNGTSPDPGLSLSTSGVFSGSPTVASTCPTGPTSVWAGAAPANLFQIKVTDGKGQTAIQQYCLGVYYPTPQVTGISPATTIADGQSHVLTINGSNFRNNSAVYAASTAVPAAFVDSNHMTVTLSPSTTSQFNIGTISFSDGTFPLWIVQPAANLSNQDQTFTISDPPPTLSQVSAVLNNSTLPCTPNLNCQLVISGTGFASDTVFTIVETSTQLQRVSTSNGPLPWTGVTTTAFSVGGAGQYTLSVTNPGQSPAQMLFTVSP